MILQLHLKDLLEDLSVSLYNTVGLFDDRTQLPIRKDKIIDHEKCIVTSITHDAFSVQLVSGLILSVIGRNIPNYYGYPTKEEAILSAIKTHFKDFYNNVHSKGYNESREIEIFTGNNGLNNKAKIDRVYDTVFKILNDSKYDYHLANIHHRNGIFFIDFIIDYRIHEYNVLRERILDLDDKESSGKEFTNISPNEQDKFSILPYTRVTLEKEISLDETIEFLDKKQVVLNHTVWMSYRNVS